MVEKVQIEFYFFILVSAKNQRSKNFSSAITLNSRCGHQDKYNSILQGKLSVERCRAIVDDNSGIRDRIGIGFQTYQRRKTGQQLTIKWEKCMTEIVTKYPENQTNYLLPIIKELGDEPR